jgi:hypothetical protein
MWPTDILKRLKERLDPKRKDFVPFIILLFITAAVFIASMVFHIDPVLFIVAFSILFLFTWVMAGIAIFRALVISSVALTFILFIADEFCKVKNITPTQIEAAKSLFAFGLIYVAIIFIKSLWREVVGHDNKKGTLKTFEEIYGGKKPWLVITLYGLSLGLFLWQLYLVFYPIVNNLCIYN